MTSLSDQNCRHTFVERMSSILAEQGEMQEVADKLAESTTTVLLTGSRRSARMPRSEERGGMAARSEAEVIPFLVYRSLAWKGGVFTRARALFSWLRHQERTRVFVEQKSSDCLLRLFSRQGLYAVQEQSDLHCHRFTHRLYVCRVGGRVGVFVRRHKIAGNRFLG